MARIAYEKWDPQHGALTVIDQANEICRVYRAQGYDLTLRQLYYQFVSRGYIENNAKAYKRLGDIINKARMAGLLDWDYIVDRTRNLEKTNTWNHPSEILEAVASQFKHDFWKDQPNYVEVWVEKEALAGVVERAAEVYRVPWFSCRGYVSQSEQWAASVRLRKQIELGKRVTIVHLGDHDPSGIDMTRDISDRLMKFVLVDLLRKYRTRSVDELAKQLGFEHSVEVIPKIDRIALNMDQVEQYDPPPNFAKITDSRFISYQEVYGDDSWELDALEPNVLNALISSAIEDRIDWDLWDTAGQAEDSDRAKLKVLSRDWDALSADIEPLSGDFEWEPMPRGGLVEPDWDEEDLDERSTDDEDEIESDDDAGE